MGDGQTQTSAFRLFAGLSKAVEGLKDALLLFWRNTRTIVPHFDANLVTVQACTEFYSAAVRSEFDRVSQKVHEYLLEPGGVTAHGQTARASFGQHVRLLVSERLHHA